MTTIDRPSTHDFDTTVRPQDDLFGHVNGAWTATVQIPEDRAVYGSFDILRDQAEVDVRAIIEESAEADAPAGSEQRKIGDLFASFMAEDAIEAAGVTPLQPLLARVDAVTDKDGLVRLFGELAPQGVGGPSRLRRHRRPRQPEALPHARRAERARAARRVLLPPARAR